MHRRQRPFRGGVHRGFPAQAGLLRIVRKVATLFFQRHDILHLGVTGLELVDACRQLRPFE